MPTALLGFLPPQLALALVITTAVNCILSSVSTILQQASAVAQQICAIPSNILSSISNCISSISVSLKDLLGALVSSVKCVSKRYLTFCSVYFHFTEKHKHSNYPKNYQLTRVYGLLRDLVPWLWTQHFIAESIYGAWFNFNSINMSKCVPKQHYEHCSWTSDGIGTKSF